MTFPGLLKGILKKPWTLVVGLSLLALGASLAYPFIALDDAKHIWQNPYVRTLNLENFLKFWREPYYGLYIPIIYNTWQTLALITQTLGLTHPITGLNALFFHWATLGFHLFNIYLCWHILRGWIWSLQNQNHQRSPLEWNFLATLATLPFALHPLQTESTVWASGLKDTMSSCFALLSILLLSSHLIDSPKTKKSKGTGDFSLWPQWASARPLFIVFVAGVFALLSKPSTVVLPLIIIALVSYSPKPLKKFTTLILLLLAGAAWLILTTKGAQPDARLEFHLDLPHRLMVAPASLGFYIFKFLIPYPLAPDYGLTPTKLLELRYAPTLIFLGVIFIFTTLWAVLRKKVKIAIPLVFILLGFAPVLGLVPFEFQNMSTVADRYFYLFPALGSGLLLALAFARLSLTTIKRAIALLVVLWLPLTLVQASHWRSTDALFLHTAQVNSQSYLSFNNLGLQALRRGDFESAAHYLDLALKAKPEYLAAIANLGVVYFKEHDYQKTIEHYESYLKKLPPAGPGSPATFADMHFNLGAAYVNTRQMDRAIKNLELATQINPDHFLAHFHLGRALLVLGDRDGAKRELSQAYRLNPQDPGLQQELKKLE